MELLINGGVRMTRREFDGLLNYSSSLPSGTTPGKSWRRACDFRHQRPSDPWMRGTYGKPYPEGHAHHGSIPIIWQNIVIEGQAPSWPRSISVPPAPMRGRMVAWVPPAPPEPELPEGLWRRRDGTLVFECRGCERSVEFDCEPEDFDPEVAYCGGSPRCLP